MSSRLDAALAYAGKGWAVLPLRGKLPAIAKANGGRGVHDATTDMETIIAWWTKWPNSNIGVACGKASGFWTLDVDPRHDGDETLAELEKLHGVLPATVEQFTGGGGRHVLFKFNGDAIRNRVNSLGTGLDVRATGGYIVVEPSCHPETKQPYAWNVDAHPDEVEIADAPGWLLARVVDKPKEPAPKAPQADPYLAFGQRVTNGGAYAEVALKQESEAVETALAGQQEGTLNAAALKIGSLVGAGALEYDTALDTLTEAGLRMANAPDREPWTREQIAAKVEHGLRDGMATPRRPKPCLVSNTKTEQSLPRIKDGSADRWLGKKPVPIEFTIEDLVPEGMVTLLIADGGAGKSLLAQLAMACLPTGQDFLGKTTKSGAAVGIFAEDPDPVLHIRQVRINQELEIDMEDLGGRSFPQSYSQFDATLWRDGKPTAFLGDLENQLQEIEDGRFLVLDNAALLYQGNENSRPEVTAFIRALTGMAERVKIGILLTGHTSKTSDDTVSKAGSGTTAWIFAARSVLKLESDGDEATLKLIKSNHVRPGLEIPLEWQSGVLVAKAPPDSLEERARKRQIDRLIFERVERAWVAGWPLSPTAQTGERYLPKALAKRGGFKAKEIMAAMHMHLEAGNLQHDQLPKKGLTGLRVVRELQVIKSYE